MKQKIGKDLRMTEVITKWPLMVINKEKESYFKAKFIQCLSYVKITHKFEHCLPCARLSLVPSTTNAGRAGDRENEPGIQTVLL